MSDWMDELSAEKRAEIDREAEAYASVRQIIGDAAEQLADLAAELYPAYPTRAFDYFVHTMYDALMAASGIQPVVIDTASMQTPPAVVAHLARANETALYRAYDAHGVLLYVGITKDPQTRMRGHERTSEWWAEMQSVSFEWFDTRRAALDEETRLIGALRPPFNVDKNPEAVR